jgi:hypothetical protein
VQLGDNRVADTFARVDERFLELLDARLELVLAITRVQAREVKLELELVGEPARLVPGGKFISAHGHLQAPT